MNPVNKVQIVLKWVEEGENGWDHQEKIFNNVHVFAQYLRARKDIAYHVDYIPKSERKKRY